MRDAVEQTDLPATSKASAGEGHRAPATAVQLKAALRDLPYDAQVQLLSAGPEGEAARADMHARAQAGLAGSGSPLPHGEAIQRSFGRYDVSQITAHMDAAAQMAADSMGAEAYATGDHVVLGEGGDNLHTIAHEAAHVVQQRAGVSLAGGVGRAGDAYEQHADAVADLVVQGKSAEGLLDEVADSSDRASTPTGSQAVQRSPAERLTGNPNELTNTAGNATTRHRTPALFDATNVPAFVAPERREDVKNVKVVTDATAPLRSEPPTTPPASALYIKDDSAQSPAPAGFTTITGYVGTVAAPVVEQEANHDLFIDGGPTPSDVQQSGIGDCYLLAAVMSMAGRDPGRIQQMMTPDGQGGATVRLWRTQQRPQTPWEELIGRQPERTWTQVEVAVSNELAFRIADDRIHGAQLRSAEAPKSAAHWADIQGERLAICALETFQCARWVPLLEKAYARFAQDHDQYGGTHPNGGRSASGYQAIHGGHVSLVLSVLYGPDTDTANVQWQPVDWGPEMDTVAKNRNVIELLAQLEGRGNSTGPDDTDAPILTAGTSSRIFINRLALALPAAQSDPDYVNVSAERQTLVGKVATSVAAWQQVPDDPSPPKLAAQKVVASACRSALVPGLNEGIGQQPILDGFRAIAAPPIAFDPNATAVPQAREAGLARLNEHLAFYANPRVRVDVHGHAVSQAPEADNQRLADQRASEVQSRIQSPRAIAPHTTTTHARGETDPDPDPTAHRVDLDVVHVGHDENSLLSDARSPAIRAAVDLMLNLRNAGTDYNRSQRNVYGNHAYSVEQVYLVASAVDKEGQLHLVPFANLPRAMHPPLYGRVDPQRSTVRLRNPHLCGEPDRRDNDQPTHAGDGPPSTRNGKQADGLFTMTLDEFFRNFTCVENGVFSKI